MFKKIWLNQRLLKLVAPTEVEATAEKKPEETGAEVKAEGKEGKKVEFKEVLLVADENGKEVEIGTPVVKGKKVSGAIVNQFRDDKITVIKYKAKSRYRRKKGHRQHKTLVKIESIA